MNHIAVLTLLASCASMAEPEQTAHRKLVESWMEVCAAHAADYRMEFAGDPKRKISLHKQPVFRHAQPVRGAGDIGAVWVWVDDDGRPAAIGTVFCFEWGGGGYRSMAHEFHSLADEPLKTTWRNRSLWSPAKPGIEWKLIPDAPEPADSESKRSRQIRALAGRFAAHSMKDADSRWELRLISKPVFRYQGTEGQTTLDSAVMAMCQGTDPEVFLVIEARKTDAGYRWHYGFAAFSDYELHGRLDDTEVWSITNAVSSQTAPHWWDGFIERIRLPEAKEGPVPKRELKIRVPDGTGTGVGNTTQSR